MSLAVESRVVLTWQMRCGEARTVLDTLPAASIQCIVTSPPYWGLRDYGVDGQIGLESTPDAYVAALVAVFASARRVLADDGVLWLNLGDSYNAYNGGAGPSSQLSKRQSSERPQLESGFGLKFKGLKPKDLVGIPWRVAFALQTDGWYLRSDVIWSKPNPMPESVTDRPTKAHEYVFLLTKSARYAYHYDAIREAYAPSPLREFEQPYDGEATKDYGSAGVQNPSSVKARIVAAARDKQRGHSRRHAGFNDRWDAMSREDQIKGGANARSVWTIPTEASPYEHFAVMPKALARKCILAGCAHGQTVLDPFAGVATTGAVAIEEGRSFIGVELNPKYHALARERLANVAPLLAAEEIA